MNDGVEAFSRIEGGLPRKMIFVELTSSNFFFSDALKFASEQLAERGEEEPSVLEELERTLALLAFEDPSQSPFADLLSLSHRQKVCRGTIKARMIYYQVTFSEFCFDYKSLV